MFFLAEKALLWGNYEPMFDMVSPNALPYHPVMGTFSYHLSHYVVVAVPKRALWGMWGRRKKDPVLTATLMASIWVLGKPPKNFTIRTTLLL